MAVASVGSKRRLLSDGFLTSVGLIPDGPPDPVLQVLIKLSRSVVCQDFCKERSHARGPHSGVDPDCQVPFFVSVGHDYYVQFLRARSASSRWRLARARFTVGSGLLVLSYGLFPVGNGH